MTRNSPTPGCTKLHYTLTLLHTGQTSSPSDHCTIHAASPSLHVHVCVSVRKSVRRRGRSQRRESECAVFEIRGNSAAGFPHFFFDRL